MTTNNPTVGITVQIDDAALQKKLLFGINQLTDEDCKDIAKAAMIQYLSMSSVMEKFFFKHDSYGYHRTDPTDFAKRLMEVAINDSEIVEEANKILQTIKDNHQEMLQKALATAFCSKLYDHEFMEIMRQNLLRDIREGNQ